MAKFGGKRAPPFGKASAGAAVKADRAKDRAKNIKEGSAKDVRLDNALTRKKGK